MNTAAVRRHVSSWPGVGEEVKWSDILVFSVGGRMFCAMHAADARGLAFKVEASRFLEFTDRPGVVPAPFMTRWHWVSLAVADALPEAEIRASIRHSYERVRGKLSRKLQRELAD